MCGHTLQNLAPNWHQGNSSVSRSRFLIYWSGVRISPGARTSDMRSVDYLGFAWTAAQCLVLAGVFLAGCYEHADGDAWISIVGGVMMTASLLPAILGFRHLGPNLSPWPQPHATNKLVTHGIYRRLRHPLLPQPHPPRRRMGHLAAKLALAPCHGHFALHPASQGGP